MKKNLILLIVIISILVISVISVISFFIFKKPNVVPELKLYASNLDYLLYDLKYPWFNIDDKPLTKNNIRLALKNKYFIDGVWKIFRIMKNREYEYSEDEDLKKTTAYKSLPTCNTVAGKYYKTIEIGLWIEE